MTTVTQAFTATGNGNGLLVRTDQSYTYTVTGTFVATWVVESTKDGFNYVQVATGTGTQTAVTVQVNEPNSGNLNVRFRCSAFTSGTITTVLADQADITIGTEIEDGDGIVQLRVKDGGVDVLGTLDVTGLTTLASLAALLSLQVDNLKLDGNTLSSTDTDGDINLSPNGTGTVLVNTDLDVDNININGNAITSTNTNGDVTISPNGTGDVVVNGNFVTSGIQIKPGSATLSFGATVTMNCNSGNVFDLTMTSNATLSAINLTAGGQYIISVAQNATASGNTLGYASLFEFEGSVAPVLSLASAAKDTFTCYSPEGTTLRGTLTKNFG